MKFSLNQQGFSLLECILTLVLLSPVVLGLLSILWFMNGNSEKIQEQEELQYFSRVVLHTIINDVKQAESISINQDKNKLTLISPGNKRIEYYCQEENVYQHGSSKVPLAEKIGELSFELLGENWVEITVKSGRDNLYQVRTSCAAWSSRW